jgi:UPF0755 protein
MQNTQPDPYANYEKDFVHIPEKNPSPIEIVPEANEAFDTKKHSIVLETKNHPILKAIMFGILICTLSIIAGAYYVYTSFTKPVTPLVIPTIVNIPKGTSLQQVTNKLSQAGVIRSAFVFRSSMIFAGFDSAIKEGEYTFSKNISMIDVIERLVKGDYQYIPVKLIIREGEDARTIATSIASAFPKLATTTMLTRLTELEGRLFPETYMFPPFASEDLIIKTISNEYAKRIAPYQSDIASSTYTELQILTIASILEREVPKKEDMHIVSGIIYNRLKKNMPLQMDSTLGYVTGKASLELTTADLQMDSPYNTYKNTGIPPAPIGNPGDASIEAALRPETHQYIFFLSDKDGVNHYAVTYAEHLNNRKKYLGK